MTMIPATGALASLALAAAVGASPRLDVAFRPFVDLHFHVRALASRQERPPDLPGFAEAVAAVAALDAEFGTPLAWGHVEGRLGECATAAEAREALSLLPETAPVSPGRPPLALRAGALRLVEALARAEPAFLEKVWPEHRAAIEAAAARAAKGLGPKESECLEFIARHLALDVGGSRTPTAPTEPIRVRLAADLPAPGAVTHRAADGRGVCFVGVRGAEGSRLFETILHEAIHALDVASGGASALQELRSRLEKGGIRRGEREWRDVPHTLMFVQAGETVRRIVDASHEHYGVAAGYYEKLRPIADLELAAWTSYLDGRSTRDEAIERIVAGVLAGRNPR